MNIDLTYEPKTNYHHVLCDSPEFRHQLQTALSMLVEDRPELLAHAARGIVYFPYNEERYMGDRSVAKNRVFVELLLLHPPGPRPQILASYKNRPFHPEPKLFFQKLSWLSSEPNTDKLDLILKYVPQRGAFLVTRSSLLTREIATLRIQQELELTSAAHTAITSLSAFAQIRAKFLRKSIRSSVPCPYCHASLELKYLTNCYGVHCTTVGCHAFRKLSA